ncbi:MAG TPA: helix-turn-helix transcriptional regulator [Tepidisphaeraceae bacterium]|nr:helix-turn-helix transcriptional regulator [Tepidisphaeraceae bacterium]
MPQTLNIKGETFYLLDADEYRRLSGGELPALPVADDAGNVRALEYARASLVRKIAAGMEAKGWSQAELARQAGLPKETINRLMTGKNTPNRATLAKIDKALAARPRSR